MLNSKFFAKSSNISLHWLRTLILLMLCTLPSWAFSIDDVAKQAQTLAEKGYEAPKSNVPSQFREMKFADYQQIQFNHNKALWNNLPTPFRIEFYHQGMYFDQAVQIHEVTETSINRIKYASDMFSFGSLNYDPNAVKDLGFAGFKILYPINQIDKNDEIISMLGASYFRIIGKGQVYGLSARGLAIDTALASGEEFPYFREFWIERPKANNKYLLLYALLDSPRATGAYRFVIHPGRDTIVDVQSRIYLRNKIGKLGLAPLTSMFLFGPNQPATTINFRPALHDSNGLLIHAGNDEWIWRPLNNPHHLSISTFQVENPYGFGLLQRGRDFFQYQDLDDRYDLRPSGWVEPCGNWGKGSIELVEIPTNDETNDNIVTFWKPETLPDIGQPLELTYRLRFSLDEDKIYSPDLAYVKQTLRSFGDIKQTNLARQPDGTTAFQIDFVGQSLKKLDMATPVTSKISVDNNTDVVENSVRFNPVTHGWRLILRLKLKDIKQPTEIRAALVNNDKILTETWSYLLPANE